MGAWEKLQSLLEATSPEDTLFIENVAKKMVASLSSSEKKKLGEYLGSPAYHDSTMSVALRIACGTKGVGSFDDHDWRRRTKTK